MSKSSRALFNASLNGNFEGVKQSLEDGGDPHLMCKYKDQFGSKCKGYSLSVAAGMFMFLLV